MKTKFPRNVLELNIIITNIRNKKLFTLLIKLSRDFSDLRHVVINWNMKTFPFKHIFHSNFLALILASEQLYKSFNIGNNEIIDKLSNGLKTHF